MNAKPDLWIAPPIVRCTPLSRDTGEVMLRIEIRNDGEETIYLFDSPQMPYLIRQDDNSLLVLYGVNPPDPNTYYNLIQIPTTQPLKPRQTIDLTVGLVPLVLHDHYQFQPEQVNIHGRITVHCKVGWGNTPITQKDRGKLSITALLTWQHLVETEPLHITLP